MKGAKLLGTEWKSAKGSDINREALRACPDGGGPVTRTLGTPWRGSFQKQAGMHWTL